MWGSRKHGIVGLVVGLALLLGGGRAGAQPPADERVLLTLGDGSQLVVQVQTGLVQLRAAGAAPVVLRPAGPGRADSWAASPDSRWISWISLPDSGGNDAAAVNLWDRRTATLSVRTTPQLGFQPAWAEHSGILWRPSSQSMLVMGWVAHADPPVRQLYEVPLSGPGQPVVTGDANRIPFYALANGIFYYIQGEEDTSLEQLWRHEAPGRERFLHECRGCEFDVQGQQMVSHEDRDLYMGTWKTLHRWDLQSGQALPDGLPGTGGFARSRSFPQTGHAVRGLFLDYWESHGGLAQQGYPLSDPVPERSPLDGQVYTVQYFERALFELHPDNAPPNQVLLAQLGRLRYQALYPQGAANQQAARANGRYFPQTGHTLGGAFRAYWESHGRLAQQGYPLSDEFLERSALDGRTYTVQYFERAVLEWHPENAPPDQVLLSLLGTLRLHAHYPGAAAP